MKKQVLLAAALLVSSSFSLLYAQGFYLKVNAGYNWPGFQNNATLMAPRVDAGNTTSDGLVTMANIDDEHHSYQQVHYSYAAGANLSFGAGYMITHWFGVEVDAHYLWGGSVSSDVRASMAPLGLPDSYIDAHIKTYSKNGVTVTPMLVFVAAKKEWKVQPYAKIGLVLPVNGRVIHEMDISSPASLPFDPFFVGNHNSVVLNTQSTFSLGYTGTVGVRYSPIPFITVFADMSAQWLNIRAKQTNITKWESYDNATGKTYDMIHPDPNTPGAPARPLYRTEFVYVDQLTSSSNNADYNANYDQNKPKEDIRNTAPAHNVGIQIGVQFNFGKVALASVRKKKP